MPKTNRTQCITRIEESGGIGALIGKRESGDLGKGVWVEGRGGPLGLGAGGFGLACVGIFVCESMCHFRYMIILGLEISALPNAVLKCEQDND